MENLPRHEWDAFSLYKNEKFKQQQFEAYCEFYPL